MELDHELTCDKSKRIEILEKQKKKYMTEALESRGLEERLNPALEQIQELKVKL